MSTQGSGDYRPVVNDAGYPLATPLPTDTKLITLEQIPTEILVKEVLRRQLSQKLDGVISVKPNGQVSFELAQILWPVGDYHVKIECIGPAQIQNQPNGNQG